MKVLKQFALVLAAWLAAPALAAGGDANAGKAVFVNCAACHKIDTSGRSGIGPNLNRVVGRRAGTYPGFSYSPAMTAANRGWTEAALDAYLQNPRQAVPGNRMPFAGLRSADDRRNVIAYLKSASR